MTEALANSGIGLSTYLYGGIGVALVAIAAFIFLFRRKSRLQEKQVALKQAYSSTEALNQPAVNMESLATPDEANKPQENIAARDIPPPVEEAGDQSGLDLAAMFRSAESVVDDDESGEESDSAGDESGQDSESANKESEQVPEPTDEKPEGKPQEQPPSGDAMLDLFTTEVVEDDNVGKLAASLDDVDLSDIMSEAQSLIEKLKGTR